MIYFDTDVLIHTIIEQDLQKRAKSLLALENSYKTQTLGISLLSIQEVGFVLGKMNLPHALIEEKLNFFLTLRPFQLNNEHYNRAFAFASIIGFKNFNDCLHLAIAETHCKELYTFNKKDFSQIKKIYQPQNQYFNSLNLFLE